MTKTTSVIARLAAAATLACGAAAPGYAQTIVDMPTLSFPTRDGVWGCKLAGRCTDATISPTGKLTRV